MPDDPAYFLLKGPSLPSASDATSMLGRIVKNYAQPLSDYTPDDASSFNPRPLNSTPLSNVARIVTAASSSALESKLLSLATLDTAKSESSKESLLSSEIRALELQNQGDVFQRLMRNSEVRKQVVGWTEPGGDPLYMIVGVLIWQDATMEHNVTFAGQHDASIKAPIGAAGSAAIASQTGLFVPPESIGDVSFEHQSASSVKTSRSAESKESQIFAVQCRIVRRRKRNIFTRSAPVLENRGPRVEGGRSFAGKMHVRLVQPRNEEADAVLELDPDDVPWTDALEDLDEPPDINVSQVKHEGFSLSLAYEL